MSEEPAPAYTATGQNGDDYVILVSPAEAEQIERQLIALLITLWKVQGKRRKIVKIE